MGGLACLPYFEQQQPSFRIILRLVNPVLSSSSASSASSASSSSSAITTLSRILPGFWPNRKQSNSKPETTVSCRPELFQLSIQHQGHSLFGFCVVRYY